MTVCGKGLFFYAELVLRHALTFWNNWSHVNNNNNAGHPSRGNIRWARPESGRLKLNTDASLDASTESMSLGWVLRDHEGVFLAAKNMHLQGIYTVNKAEAIGLREALSWLKGMGMGGVDVEMDSQNVFYSLSNPSFSSTFGIIIDDVKELTSMIDNVKFF
ncbi:PREDICTED: uncharacterized protein LOC109157025 [Ipomoea nil]|uniref:uncharacterized protein LOC109157025 n=1 Tax=Ipomoea nil TaxID=35883 RepID=UPI000900F474|nr:PREDICTED: uncharacterized protein LOC109157025 [Ipomoea nil]